MLPVLRFFFFFNSTFKLCFFSFLSFSGEKVTVLPHFNGCRSLISRSVFSIPDESSMFKYVLVDNVKSVGLLSEGQSLVIITSIKSLLC